MHTRIRSLATRAFLFAVPCGIAAMVAAPAFGQDRYLPPSMPRSQGAAPRPVPPSAAAQSAAPSAPTATVTVPPAKESAPPVTGESLLRLFTPEEPARVGTPAASGTATSGATTSGNSAPPFQPSAGAPGARSSRPGSDPTAPGPDLKKLMGTGGPEQRPVGPPPLPEITLRARVFARGKPPVAIIEVAGKQLSVRKGSAVQVPLGAGGAVQLLVLELDSAGLQIQVVDREQVIVLD